MTYSVASPQKMKRVRRHRRVRAKISCTSLTPRLAVFRSSHHISGQLIDDGEGKTLVAGYDTILARKELSLAPKELSAKARIAFVVGKKLAEAACARGIVRIVFDRGGFSYHGRIKAFADGARAGGLEF